MFRPYPQPHRLETDYNRIYSMESRKCPMRRSGLSHRTVSNGTPIRATATSPSTGAFAEASEAFEEPVVVRKSNRSNEERWIAVGRTHGRMVTVVFTIRGRMIRIISARHPRPDEKRAYGNASMGRTTPGKN